MEYIIMFVTHILKTVHYFIVAGFPDIPIALLPEAAEAFFWQTVKLAEIYAAMIFK